MSDCFVQEGDTPEMLTRMPGDFGHKKGKRLLFPPQRRGMAVFHRLVRLRQVFGATRRIRRGDASSAVAHIISKCVDEGFQDKIECRYVLGFSWAWCSSPPSTYHNEVVISAPVAGIGGENAPKRHAPASRW